MASKLTLGPSLPREDYVRTIESYQKKKSETLARLMRGEFRNVEERLAYMKFLERFSPSPWNALSGAYTVRGIGVSCALEAVPIYTASRSRLNLSSEGVKLTPSLMRISGIPANVQILSALIVCDGISRTATPSEIARAKEVLSSSGCLMISVDSSNIESIPPEIAQILKTCSLAKRVGHNSSIVKEYDPSERG